MPAVRRLAAILAADVAGYSRLMGADEEGTHERLKAHRRELVDPKISEHSGRIVKTTGDGILVEFPSVVDAVRCAAELQRAMIDREAGMPEDRRIRFRIGINLGDVIVEDDDIFGDGVNVAARLEALSDPGGLCISRMVRDQIRDKLTYAFEDLGEQSVKNIARPVRIYALRREAVAALPASSVPPALPISQPAVVPLLSIVVLPFTNLSSHPEQQYFTDGITEDLTTDLSRLADMFVISRNTAFTYRNKPVDTKQIGRELCVRYVLGETFSGRETRSASLPSWSKPKPMRMCGPSGSPVVASGRTVAGRPCPRRCQLRLQKKQGSLVVVEVRRVQDLNAGVVLAIERRHPAGAAVPLRVVGRVEPKAQMVGLWGVAGFCAASGNGGSLKTSGAFATPGATMNVSMLKRPLKCWNALPLS
jgi:class 3 adenylate cyclase